MNALILARMFIPTRSHLEAALLVAGQAVLVLSIATLIVGALAIVTGGVIEGVKLRIQRQRVRRLPVTAPLAFTPRVTPPAARKQLDAIDDAWMRLQLDGLAMTADVQRRQN